MSGGRQQRAVFIVRTGTANLASVCAGFQRLGVTPHITADPAVARDAACVVLPGVGAFGAAMAQLTARGLDVALRQRMVSDKPTLAICLGLQLLCESSTESPGVAGLGVVRGAIDRFGANVRVPQLGWNEVVPDTGARWLTRDYAYFANSYRLTTPPPDCQVAWTDYGGRFVCAFERGRLLACQFHPELSGPWGLELLRRWLEQVE